MTPLMSAAPLPLFFYSSWFNHACKGLSSAGEGENFSLLQEYDAAELQEYDAADTLNPAAIPGWTDPVGQNQAASARTRVARPQEFHQG